jgi:hypothetical protein
MGTGQALGRPAPGLESLTPPLGAGPSPPRGPSPARLRHGGRVAWREGSRERRTSTDRAGRRSGRRARTRDPSAGQRHIEERATRIRRTRSAGLTYDPGSTGPPGS